MGSDDGGAGDGLAHILSRLSQEERLALRAVAFGVAHTASDQALTRLYSFGLVNYEAQGLSLTAKGRSIEPRC